MAYTSKNKIDQLDELTALDDTDVLMAGDQSDADRAKKITWTNLKTAITSLVEGLTSYFNVTNDTLDDITDGTTYKKYTATEKTKLSGIATGATANDTDANLKARANHTGTQTASTISDFDTEVANNSAVAANTAKISFDATSSAKLAGIEAGAEVNNISDVNATALTGGGQTALHSHASGSVEGTAVLSTGVTAGKVLQADGDNTSSWVSLSGGGDMLASTYDPGSVAGNVFDMDNMVEGTNKILTAAERTKLNGLLSSGIPDITDDNSLYFDTANSKGFKYGSVDGVMKLEGGYLGTDTALDFTANIASGDWSPYITFSTDGTLTLAANQHSMSNVVKLMTSSPSNGVVFSNALTPAQLTWDFSALTAPRIITVPDTNIDLSAIATNTAHTTNTSNPHSVTKAQVGLSNVDDTSDATKNSATATLTNKTLNKPVINGSTQAKYGATDGATVTFSLAVANIGTVTLGGNRTLALSGVDVGQVFMLELTQDATGSRTVTWFSTIKWAGGTAPTLTTTANKTDIFGFRCTSSGNYYGFPVAQNI